MNAEQRLKEIRQQSGVGPGEEGDSKLWNYIALLEAEVVRLVGQREQLREALEEQIWQSVDEDDSHEEFLLFWCRECDSNAKDDRKRIVHLEDCSVKSAETILAATEEL